MDRRQYHIARAFAHSHKQTHARAQMYNSIKYVCAAEIKINHSAAHTWSETAVSAFVINWISIYKLIGYNHGYLSFLIMFGHLARWSDLYFESASAVWSPLRRESLELIYSMQQNTHSSCCAAAASAGWTELKEITLLCVSLSQIQPSER